MPVVLDRAAFDEWLDPAIAAYDWRTFIGEGQRLVAFADGHVEFLDPEKAEALFEAQGIRKPMVRDE